MERGNKVNFFSDYTEAEPDFQSFFVGRGQELETLAAHFRSGGRSAVVYGVRGSGKTALVRVFAETGREMFPGGVKKNAKGSALDTGQVELVTEKNILPATADNTGVTN